MDKVTRRCPQTTTFLKRKESRSGIERGPSAYQPNALPLGQTGYAHQERKNRLYIWSVTRPVAFSKVVAADLADAAGDCMYSCCCGVAAAAAAVSVIVLLLMTM